MYSKAPFPKVDLLFLSGGGRFRHRRQTSHRETTSTSTGMDWDGSSGHRKQFTSTGTQCNLGNERTTSRHVPVGTQLPEFDDKSSFAGTEEEGDSIISSIVESPVIDAADLYAPGGSINVLAKADFDGTAEEEPVVVMVPKRETERRDDKVTRDVPKEEGYYTLLYNLPKDDDDSVYEKLVFPSAAEEQQPSSGPGTDGVESKLVSSLEQVIEDQDDVIESVVTVHEVETAPDMFAQLEAPVENQSEAVTPEEVVITRHQLGDIIEGAGMTHSSPPSAKRKKRLVKQKTFPLTTRDTEPEEADRARKVLVASEAEDVRRAAPLTRCLSYADRRRVSLEKLKSSMDDVGLLLGRRKSQARDMLLSEAGVDYHSFLIWIMFSEGELNNVKCASATYTILMEQKAYLLVIIFCFHLFLLLLALTPHK